MEELKPQFQRFLRNSDLLRASMILGKVSNPAFDMEGPSNQILELASEVWSRAGNQRYDSVAVLKYINQVLFSEFGLRARDDRFKNLIDDPARVYLHEALIRKHSSALTVTVLYCVLCEQVGIPFECIAIPSAYFLKIPDVAGDIYVEPFDSGKTISEADFSKRLRSAMARTRMSQASLYESIGLPQLVARLVQQLKQIYILRGSPNEALQCVELLSVLYPSSPEVTRDRGILYCEMEYFSKAAIDLKSYLRERPDAEDVSEIRKLTTMLKGYQEIMN